MPHGSRFSLARPFVMMGATCAGYCFPPSCSPARSLPAGMTAARPRRRPGGRPRLRFPLKRTNEGENAAVNVATSDFWEEGLEVTAIGSVEDQQPKAIEDRGLEFILREFAAGKSVELVYTARCRESGEWVNAAAAGAANAGPAEAKLTVTCP